MVNENKLKSKLELKRFGTQKARYKQILQPINPAPQLSQEQDMLNDLFGGRGENRVMFQNPSSQCVTELKGSLMTNTINGDDNETAETFGMGIDRRTGGFFGI